MGEEEEVEGGRGVGERGQWRNLPTLLQNRFNLTHAQAHKHTHTQDGVFPKSVGFIPVLLKRGARISSLPVEPVSDSRRLPMVQRATLECVSLCRARVRSWAQTI